MPIACLSKKPYVLSISERLTTGNLFAGVARLPVGVESSRLRRNSEDPNLARESMETGHRSV